MGVNGLTMNSKSFAKLPAEVQKIIVEVGRGYEEQAGKSLNARQKSGLEGLEKVGAKIKTLGEDARAGWAKSLADFPSRQAKDADGRGMPGTEVIKAYLNAVDVIGYKWPIAYDVK
jgi:TRAP-type C4-dicarboxylate transport system substrate-binding protein